MEDSMEVDESDRHLISTDSIKVMAESIGISNLNEDVCKRLSEEMEFRLKEIVQNGIKFMRHSKRNRLSCGDIDNALRSKNIEPLYGFECSEYIPLRHSSGGGKEIYYPDDQEVDLVSIVSSPLPKLPCDVSLHSHWLAVDGVQPLVPENVPSLSLEEQRKQAVALSLNSQDASLVQKDVRLERKRKKEEEGVVEVVKLKSLQPHMLTMEQQLYYKELTDACVGLSDSKRQEGLTSLSTDPSVYQLLPQLIAFMTEGIKVNIGQRKLPSLRNLLKMVKALLDNTSISIERYLHDLIPSVSTCLLNRHLCTRPESEDHWSLRELSAKILSMICKKYSNSVNNIQTRLTRILSQTLQGLTLQELASHYGAVACFGELGQEAISACVIPRLKQEGELIKSALIGGTGSSKIVDQVAANKLQGILQRHCSPVLHQTRSATDTIVTYQQDYGYMGTCLFNQVKSLRQGRPILSLSNLAGPSGSPTSPKTKLSPITVGSPSQVTATKISKGGIPGGLRLQINSPGGGGTSVATIPVSLLSAFANPSVVQAFANQLVVTSPTVSSPPTTKPLTPSTTTAAPVSTTVTPPPSTSTATPPTTTNNVTTSSSS